MAGSPLVDDTVWQALLDRLPSTKAAARKAKHDPHVTRLVHRLLYRQDLTEERANRLILALGTGRDALWSLMALFRNPSCPKSVYITAATSRVREVADAALGADACPDEARFAGVLAGRLLGLLKVGTDVPDEVARQAVTLIENAPSSGRDAVNEETRQNLVSTLTRFAADHGVLDWCLAQYRAAYGDKALGMFHDAVLSRHSERVYVWDPVDRLDVAMDFLAGHPDGHVRALVVPHLPAQGLALAAKDPHEAVRVAAAKHPDLGGQAWDLLAGDTSPRVQEVMANRLMAALAH